MMNHPPLNPDALEEASNAVRRITLGEVNSWDVAEAAITAYLAVAQPEVNSVEELAKAWQAGFEAGWAEAKDPSAFVNDVWDAKTPNPYTDKESSDGR